MQLNPGPWLRAEVPVDTRMNLVPQLNPAITNSPLLLLSVIVVPHYAIHSSTGMVPPKTLLTSVSAAGGVVPQGHPLPIPAANGALLPVNLDLVRLAQQPALQHAHRDLERAPIRAVPPAGVCVYVCSCVECGMGDGTVCDRVRLLKCARAYLPNPGQGGAPMHTPDHIVPARVKHRPGATSARCAS